MEYVRLHPFSVVIFPAFESVTPEALDLFESVCRRGIIEIEGRKPVSFRNCIIIAALNTDGLSRGIGFYSEAANGDQILGGIIPASVSSQIDGVILFNDLDETALRSIVSKALNELGTRAKKRRISLSFSENVVDYVVSKCGGSARNAEMIVIDSIEDALSSAILREEIMPGDNAEIIISDGEVTVRKGK